MKELSVAVVADIDFELRDYKLDQIKIHCTVLVLTDCYLSYLASPSFKILIVTVVIVVFITICK